MFRGALIEKIFMFIFYSLERLDINVHEERILIYINSFFNVRYNMRWEFLLGYSLIKIVGDSYLSHTRVGIVGSTVARTATHIAIAGRTGFNCIRCNTVRSIVADLTFFAINTGRMFLRFYKCYFEMYFKYFFYLTFSLLNINNFINIIY